MTLIMWILMMKSHSTCKKRCLSFCILLFLVVFRSDEGGGNSLHYKLATLTIMVIGFTWIHILLCRYSIGTILKLHPQSQSRVQMAIFPKCFNNLEDDWFFRMVLNITMVSS